MISSYLIYFSSNFSHFNDILTYIIFITFHFPFYHIDSSAGPQSFGNLDLSSLLGTGSSPALPRGGLTSEDLQRAMMGKIY